MLPELRNARTLGVVLEGPLLRLIFVKTASTALEHASQLDTFVGRGRWRRLDFILQKKHLYLRLFNNADC